MRKELNHIQLLPSLAPVFDRLQYVKTEGEGLVNLTTRSVTQMSHIVTRSYIAKQQ